MISLRSRLLLYVGAGQLIVVAGLSLGLWKVAKGLLAEAFDQRIAKQAQLVGGFLSQEGPFVEYEFIVGLVPEYSREENPDYFQIWIENVGPHGRSPSLLKDSVGDDDEDEYHDLPQRFGTLEEPVGWDATLLSGVRGRMVGVRFPIAEYERVDENTGKTAKRQNAIVVVATSREPLDEELGRLALGFVMLNGLVVLASLIFVLIAVRLGLRPVTALGRRVERLDAASEGEQLDTVRLPRELRPLADSIRGLLGRLRKAVDRERRLSGNIAHELRTPIAELRAVSEVALRAPDDYEGLMHSVEQAREIGVEMDQIVSMLLRLWRDDVIDDTGARRNLDVVALLRALTDSFAERAEEREVTVRGESNGTSRVLAERGALALVLGNLLDNAIEHSPEGSHVDWTVAATNGHVAVRFVNPQTVLRPGEEDAAEEPFWSDERARGSSRHAGLGLSMVRTVCETAGFGLRVDVHEDEFQVELSLDSADGEPRAPSNGVH